MSICAACSNGNESSEDESVSNTFDANEYVSNESAMAGLFHDEMQFTREDLTNGSTNCSDMLDEAYIEDRIITWPADLKGHFLRVLNRFPKQELIAQAVHGIYLVTDASMIDRKSGTTAAGLACDRGGDFKGIIFLNYNTMVKKRSALGIGNWQNSRSRSHKFIDVSEGDAAAITLMHEIFHAIDVKLFMHGAADGLQKRVDFKSKSWAGNQPKFKRGTILALNADSPEMLVQDRRCIHPEHSGLGLTAIADTKALASELEYLQERTNFIVPYTMASPAEDFAETLTVYYFGAYYQSWQKRIVSFEDQPLFVHDTERILRTKSQHIEKTCAAAELVFGSCQLR